MEVREKILQKATDLFMHYGIRSVTMDEIAVQLGVSKKTIYQFYADKDELVDAVLMNILDDNQETCCQYQVAAGNAIEEVVFATEMVKDMFENMNPSLLYDLEKHHAESYKKFNQFKYKFLREIIVDNLKRGIQEGLYRPDIDIDIITLLRLETMMLPFSYSIAKSGFSFIQVHQQLTEMFLFGIASPKGYKLIEQYKQERKEKIK
ncbi:MAG: TetR/AcrR family transcriptional regulator [Williamsia sp.]|nr:TetR/AcrR family transcriptional regulator [Williamsia sp.]